MTFKKGQSGNPGGRPRIPADVKELARAMAKPAVDALAEIVKSKKAPAAARVSAAVALLDRGYGKPAQTINANVRRSFSDISDAELAAIATGGGAEASESTDGPRPSDQVH